MDKIYYSLLTVDSYPVCLSAKSPNIDGALRQINAWVSGYVSGSTCIVSIDSVSTSKPRGIEAQDIHNYVKVK